MLCGILSSSALLAKVHTLSRGKLEVLLSDPDGREG